MSQLSDLSPLLERTPIVLVVEDRLTKEYLYSLWKPEQQPFTIVTAGGHQVVKGMVTDLRKHDPGNDRVFGLVDTDFDQPNMASWNNPGTCVLRTSHHEMENFMLDWDALAGCELNKRHNHTAAAIEGWAVEQAQKQPWWLACRKRLRTMQKLHGDDYPTAPSVDGITSFQHAFDYVAQSDWCQDLQNRTTQILDQNILQQELNQAHTEYDQHLQADQWRRTYSGKEVFRHLLSRIYDVPRSESREADVDLAISVGDWQRKNGQIPQDLIDLKQVMKTRAGI